jgi:C2 domain
MKVIGAAGLPCPEGVKDIVKLHPYVRVEIRAVDTMKKDTKAKKSAGPNAVWNETMAFHRIIDNLAFIRY